MAARAIVFLFAVHLLSWSASAQDAVRPQSKKGSEEATSQKRPTVAKPVKVAVYAPEWKTNDYERFRKALSRNDSIGRVRSIDSLKLPEAVEGEILVLVLSPKAFSHIEEYSRKALLSRSKIGIGYGAAQLFGELGLELNWDKCAHGVVRPPRILVESNKTVDERRFPSPFFLFNPSTIDKGYHNENVCGVYIGPRAADFASRIDVIAKLTTEQNYALVARQGRDVLIGVDAPVDNWSDRTLELIAMVVSGLKQAAQGK